MKRVYKFFWENNKRSSSTASNDSTLTDLQRFSDCSIISDGTVEMGNGSKPSDRPIPETFAHSIHTLQYGTLAHRSQELNKWLNNTLSMDFSSRGPLIEAILNALKNTVPSTPHSIHNKHTLFDEIRRMQGMGDLFIKYCQLLSLLLTSTDPLVLRKKAVVCLIHSTYAGANAFLTGMEKNQVDIEPENTFFYRLKQQAQIPPHNGVIRSMDKEVCDALTQLLYASDPPELRRLIIKGLCANSGYDCGAPFSGAASMSLRDICCKHPIFYSDVHYEFHNNPNSDARKKAGDQFILNIGHYLPNIEEAEFTDVSRGSGYSTCTV